MPAGGGGRSAVPALGGSVSTSNHEGARVRHDQEIRRKSPGGGIVARLSQTSIATDELRDFFAWRRAPRNRAAYQALEADTDTVSER